jgi:hypothetical protein
MSSGGNLGASAFRRYRALLESVVVQLGMRGAVARAMSLGELVVLGHAGP